MVSRAAAVLAASMAAADGKKAFVLLGATGDNAYRPAGVWTGMFEAWCAGIFKSVPTDLHVQINQGHSSEEIHDKVMGVLGPFYETIQEDKSWKCALDDCSPETFFASGEMNIWNGQGRYNASGQAANMTYLTAYDEVIAYMSLPPSAYQEWTGAMVEYWGGGSKLQLAFEKPFGGGRDSLKDATDLHQQILDSGLPASNFHLTDHWLSFFMNANLPTFRQILQPRLGIDFTSKDIEKIVVTEYEERGFGGRGAFIDGLGQVRDMVQSHLLQVLALTLLDPKSKDIDTAKLELFQSFSLDHCELKQFEGLLRSKKLSYHEDFADSTFCRVFLTSNMTEWKDTELVIQTGKAMDANLYTVEVFQRNGKGKITYNIGKEEVGLGDISVTNWPLKDSSAFDAPLPGFGATSTEKVTPQVDQDGNGYVLRYNDPNLYFPKPYSKIVNALITGDYGVAFVTWPECLRSWEIVTGSSTAQCLDPAPKDVPVYLPAFLCDLEAPEMCDQHMTVQDLYEDTYSCSSKHDAWYKDVDFYQAKCHSPGTSPSLFV